MDSSIRRVALTEPITSAHNLPEISDLDGVRILEIWFGPKVIFNSTGIRDWIRWLKPLATRKDLYLEFHEIPFMVIQLINMIANFIPENGEVISFYVPFYSEETEETQKILLRRGHEFLEDKFVLPEVKDRDGNPMTLDVDENKFFRFLKPASFPKRKN